VFAFAVSVLLASGCVTRPPKSPSAVQSRLESARVEPAAQVNGTNINTASLAELEKLPGVGRSIAERIIAHRKQYGPFRRAEHLMMVRGISDRKFRDMQTLIVVE
jgi:competence protein ComEA